MILLLANDIDVILTKKLKFLKVMILTKQKLRFL